MPHDAARGRASTPAADPLLAAAVVLLAAFVPPLVAAGGAAPTTMTTVPVGVGVMLDLATGLGKKSLLSLEMALEDFYAAHPNFTTRVELHVRDSDRDVVTAASATSSFISACTWSLPSYPCRSLDLPDFGQLLSHRTYTIQYHFVATELTNA